MKSQLQVWIDYYRVLQVHNLAEPEVIDSAYKRLVRKYHPDANAAGGSDSKIKQITEAYETLKDPQRRRVYDTEWLKAHTKTVASTLHTRKRFVPGNISPAQETLTMYFQYIKNEDFQSAYKLISSADSKKIPFKDFLNWRTTVAKIFRLHEVECRATSLNRDFELNGSTYKEVLEFLVMTAEHNAVMDRMEKDILIKKMVLEKDNWRVYVGHDDVGPLITRFEELTNLLTAKSVLHEMVEAYSHKDHMTGLLNNRGFMDIAEKEIWRYSRYGNGFSLMMVELNLSKKQQKTVVSVSRTLEQTLRKLDSIGRWGEAGFIVLMPETDLPLGIRAAHRVRDALAVECSIGVDQFNRSLGDTIETLQQLISTAKNYGQNAIATPYGIY